MLCYSLLGASSTASIRFFVFCVCTAPVDFPVCFEWLNEDRLSLSLELILNFGLTGYKTHYL